MEEWWHIRLDSTHKQLWVVKGAICFSFISFLCKLERRNRTSYEIRYIRRCNHESEKFKAIHKNKEMLSKSKILNKFERQILAKPDQWRTCTQRKLLFSSLKDSVNESSECEVQALREAQDLAACLQSRVFKRSGIPGEMFLRDSQKKWQTVVRQG